MLFRSRHLIVRTQSPSAVAGTNGVVNFNPGGYRRRQNNLTTYETPNLAGFSGMVSVTSRNHDSAATQTQIKARLWSFGAQYSNGPLFIGAAYEKHASFYAVALPAPNPAIGGDDKAWTIAASYKFANNLQLGMSYQQFKSNASLPVVGATGGETKVNTWHIGMDWMISGPHGVRRDQVPPVTDLYGGATQVFYQISNAFFWPVAVALLVLFVHRIILPRFGVVIADAQARRLVGEISVLGPAYFELLVREFGPIVSALLVAARFGSSCAAELSAMTVNEQVDALKLSAEIGRAHV